MKLSALSRLLPNQLTVQPTLYVDLGSQTIKVLNEEKDFFVMIPSCVVYHTQSGEVISVGHEALMKVGKLPVTQSLGWAVQRGVIADVPAFQHIIQQIFSRFKEKKTIVAGMLFPKIVMALPEQSTEVEIAALKKGWNQIGVTNVEFRHNGIAAAVASGIRVDELQSRVVVDIGYSCCQIFVITNGVSIAYRRILVAGNDLTTAIIRHVKHEYEVEISPESAESIKQHLGILPSIQTDKAESMTKSRSKKIAATVVRGRHTRTFSPSTVKVTAEDTTKALSPLLHQLITAIQEVFADLPPAVVADVMKYGIFLVGGSALLSGIKEAFTELLDIEVWVTEHPDTATVRGLLQLKDSLHHAK